MKKNQPLIIALAALPFACLAAVIVGMRRMIADFDKRDIGDNAEAYELTEEEEDEIFGPDNYVDDVSFNPWKDVQVVVEMTRPKPISEPIDFQLLAASHMEPFAGYSEAGDVYRANGGYL